MLQDMQALVRRAQDEICAALAVVEGAPLREEAWEREGGGGGWTRFLEDGRVLERAAVNVSVVHGTLSPEAAIAMSAGRAGLRDASPHFAAAGLSLVLHPQNPFAPTVHANYRYFERGEGGVPELWWFGGGSDLTPAYLFEDDTRHFHSVLKAACDAHDKALYPRFKKWCDAYFLIAHRGERRGVGGIFFDDLNDRPAAAVCEFVESCARAFVPSYVPILGRRKDMPFGAAHRQWQELRRGRYVEFNLVYDRGTRFGLETGGRIESILLSLPRVARWHYDVRPAPGSAEAALVEVLRSPRDWV
jgi:coproporphyrinogen III oxidase